MQRASTRTCKLWSTIALHWLWSPTYWCYICVHVTIHALATNHHHHQLQISFPRSLAFHHQCDFSLGCLRSIYIRSRRHHTVCHFRCAASEHDCGSNLMVRVHATACSTHTHTHAKIRSLRDYTHYPIGEPTSCTSYGLNAWHIWLISIDSGGHGACACHTSSTRTQFACVYTRLLRVQTQYTCVCAATYIWCAFKLPHSTNDDSQDGQTMFTVSVCVCVCLIAHPNSTERTNIFCAHIRPLINERWRCVCALPVGRH